MDAAPEVKLDSLSDSCCRCFALVTGLAVSAGVAAAEAGSINAPAARW
jgi:hypothetical protein